MKNNDTIVAISTPSGVGGISVIRISGSQAQILATTLCNKQKFENRKATFCRAEVDGTFIDELVAVYYQAPHSYTGEDVVELSCHGSIYVQQTLLNALLNQGARLAEPGEFTLRAFLNGKLDLAQSEAVADLIDSTTEAQHHLAISQLRGGFSQGLAEIRQQLVDLTSLLELELDFSDEDVEFADREQLKTLLSQLDSRISELVASFKVGNAIKNGVPVAIVGRPNVGKSTLLNALLNDDRAIVSDIPGTTRDTIEDAITIQGVLFRFIDTAGIRNNGDTIENIGIERSFKAAARSQVIILLSDEPLTEKDVELLSQQVDISQKEVLLVQNKCDVNQPQGLGIHISAKNGEGIEELKQALLKHVKYSSTDIILSNVRHYEAMTHILESLHQVREGLLQGLPADLVVIDIREALYHLGTITGQVTSDEVLGNIFSRFCIGK